MRLASFVAGVMALAASASLAGQTAPPQASTRGDNLPGAEAVKAFVAAQTKKDWSPPKTPWGDPDISGVFTTKDEANTPFERPEEWAGRRMEDITPKEFAEAISKRQEQAVERAPFAGGGVDLIPEGVAIGVPIHWFDNLAARNSRPWFVIDPPEGKVPAAAPGADARPKRPGFLSPERDTYLDRYLGDRCIMWLEGITHSPGIYGNSFQIVQSKDRVVIRYEMVHEARTIHLDGRPAPDARIHGYMGYSRGWWEGNSLVVETTNLHPQATYRGAPGNSLRVIERFTRIAPDRVEWTMTFDDPTTWTRAWTYSLPMTEDNTQLIHEYACHEGNYGMANLLSAGRAAEKNGQK